MLQRETIKMDHEIVVMDDAAVELSIISGSHGSAIRCNGRSLTVKALDVCQCDLGSLQLLTMALKL